MGTGAGPNNHFTFAMKAATATLESVSGAKFLCEGGTGSGEIATAKEVANVVLKFTDCVSPDAAECKTEGDAHNEITTHALSGVIGVAKEAETPLRDKIAEELHGTGAEQIVAEFACGPIRVILKGSVLHRVKADTKATSIVENFTATREKQDPANFANGEQHILEGKIAEEFGFQQFGISVTLINQLEEGIEINTVV
jgi:hypothetical protein